MKIWVVLLGTRLLRARAAGAAWETSIFTQRLLSGSGRGEAGRQATRSSASAITSTT
jgi:hypothetical protein